MAWTPSITLGDLQWNSNWNGNGIRTKIEDLLKILDKSKTSGLDSTSP